MTISGESGFTDLLRAIGWMQEDLMSVCTDAVTENHPDGDFRARVRPAAKAVADVIGSAAAVAGNTWYGVAPLRRDFDGRGRGTAKDVRAIRALYADLDVKPGGLGSLELAGKVITELGNALERPPVAIVLTGGGMQPYWRVRRDSDSEFGSVEAWTAAQVLLRRWGRLVAAIAESVGGSVDSVYNLDRILRIPGTANRKYPTSPMSTVEVRYEDPGEISLGELAEMLDAAGIEELPEDTSVVGEIVAPIEEWDWAPDGVLCQYVRTMVESWSRDLPEGGRHPWLIAQATRLAAVHRARLVTQEQYQEAAEALVRRFHELLGTTEPKRGTSPGEVAGAFGWGQMVAASKTDAALVSEFGGHRHEIGGGAFGEGRSCLIGVPSERPPSAGTSEASGRNASEASVSDGPAGSADEVEGIVGLGTLGGEAGHKMSVSEMFTDARMAEAVSAGVLEGRFIWVSGLGWLGWTGQKWAACSDQSVIEAMRSWAVDRLAYAVKRGAVPGDPYYEGWAKMLGATKLSHVAKFAMGIVEVAVDALDSDPDTVNTPEGICDLRTGTVRGHDPSALMTQITSGSYRPGYTHPDWEQALSAIAVDSGETIAWFQTRVGQGMTGHRSPDGVNVVLQGSGQNGKGALISDGLVPALGDYAELASHKLISGGENEHSEEMASLRGKRFLVAEELTEGKALNVSAIKRISDISYITARHVYQRNMTFRTTHTLFATTNYIPVVNETDYGTWRRLAMLSFPFTFVNSAGEVTQETDRVGDTRLKARIEQGESGQHDAAVTWGVEGAIRWYQRGADALVAPAWVAAKTAQWRGSADRITSFWAETLHGDNGSRILSAEMFEAFNDWLAGNGHKPWGREMFEARFDAHQVTTKNGVEKRRELNPKHISRYIRSADWKPVTLDLSKQHQVWVGVRFSTADDHRALRVVPALPKAP